MVFIIFYVGCATGLLIDLSQPVLKKSPTLNVADDDDGIININSYNIIFIIVVLPLWYITPRYYPQTPEPVIPPGRLAQIDLSCIDVP